MTKICPYCGQEKNIRGFHIHLKACKKKHELDPLRKRYANQIRNMSEVAAERFLRKAGGLV
jgi:hypothetical protein